MTPKASYSPFKTELDPREGLKERKVWDFFFFMMCVISAIVQVASKAFGGSGDLTQRLDLRVAYSQPVILV